MMFWLYCPIKIPGEGYVLPDNLKQFDPIVQAVLADMGMDAFIGNYIYLTAKRLYVTPDAPGNRPGWHSDGFMTDDLNYIWYDDNPTVFWEPHGRVEFTQDHELSLAEMDALCEPFVDFHKVYPCKHLLKLDQFVMHKVATPEKAGVRTFVKVSVSRHQYRHEGNSINHELDLGWEPIKRGDTRNAPECPSQNSQRGKRDGG